MAHHGNGSGMSSFLCRYHHDDSCRRNHSIKPSFRPTHTAFRCRTRHRCQRSYDCNCLAWILPLRLFHGTLFSLIGLVIIGLGCAPVYPAIIHSTPESFGRETSHAIVGIQMASAYLGSTLMPPVLGLIAQNISIALFPLYLVIFILLLGIMTERVNKVCAH